MGLQGGGKNLGLSLVLEGLELNVEVLLEFLKVGRLGNEVASSF